MGGIKCKVVEVLARYLSSVGRGIGADSRLVEDLYMDSIAMVEVVMNLNEEFGIEIAEVMVGEWRTVQDVCESIGCCGAKEW